MSKLDKMRKELENSFTAELHAAFEKKFGLKIDTTFDLLGGFQMVTRLESGEQFTIDQHAFIQGWSEAFGKAINMVLFREADDMYNAEIKRQLKEQSNVS